MTPEPFQIDILLTKLRTAWNAMNVSAEVYADALKRANRKPIHHNTLRRLEQAGWSPSVEILRELEEHLIRNPLNTDELPKRVARKPRQRRRLLTNGPSPIQQSAHITG